MRKVGLPQASSPVAWFSALSTQVDALAKALADRPCGASLLFVTRRKPTK